MWDYIQLILNTYFCLLNLFFWLGNIFFRFICPGWSFFSFILSSKAISSNQNLLQSFLPRVFNTLHFLPGGYGQSLEVQKVSELSYFLIKQYPYAYGPFGAVAHPLVVSWEVWAKKATSSLFLVVRSLVVSNPLKDWPATIKAS